MRNKVTSSGEGDVQLRMNGVNAEIQDLLVLRTEDVIRIESVSYTHLIFPKRLLPPPLYRISTTSKETPL